MEPINKPWVPQRKLWLPMLRAHQLARLLVSLYSLPVKRSSQDACIFNENFIFHKHFFVWALFCCLGSSPPLWVFKLVDAKAKDNHQSYSLYICQNCLSYINRVPCFGIYFYFEFVFFFSQNLFFGVNFRCLTKNINLSKLVLERKKKVQMQGFHFLVVLVPVRDGNRRRGLDSQRIQHKAAVLRMAQCGGSTRNNKIS